MVQSVDVVQRPSADYADLVDRSVQGAQAFGILQFVFVMALLVAGTDKFFHVLTNWEKYLAPVVPRLSGIAPQPFMHAVGIFEIMVGTLVALTPRVGSGVASLWFAVVIGDLFLLNHGYLDIALCDLVLCLAALALNRLGAAYGR